MKVLEHTPNGEYFFRFEHIGVHRSHVNQPENYAGYLQVKVQKRVSRSHDKNPRRMVTSPLTLILTLASITVRLSNKVFLFPGGGDNGGSNNGGGSTPAPKYASLYGQCGGRELCPRNLQSFQPVLLLVPLES